MTKLQKHDQDYIKQQNKKLILQTIKENRPISRADIAKITGMSPTSVSRIVNDLSNIGFVKETELTSSGLGRKAMLLDIDLDSVFTIGVDIDKETARVGIIDFDGNIKAKRILPIYSRNYSHEGYIDTICNSIEEIIQMEQLDSQKIIGIGVGIPGLIDIKNGNVIFSAQLGWKNIKIRSYIEKKLGYKTTVDNELKVKALAEHLYGSAKGSKKTVLIGFGSGVGSAVIINGEIFRGETNSAGEIGHTTVDPNGILCECGRRGCLQTYIADWALIQEANKVSKVNSSADIFEAAKENEYWALNIIDRAATYIGVTISNIICVYNPDTIILSGELIDNYPQLRKLIESKCNQLIWEPLRNTFKIVHSNLYDQSVLIGSGILALNKYLKIPI